MALGGSAARRYAEALLEIATEEGAVAEFRRSLDKLGTAFTPDVVAVLRDPRVPLDRRRAALASGVKDEPKAIRGVVELLLQRDRIARLPEVARAFGELVDKREGIVKAKITTSTALDQKAQADVVGRLEQATAKKIQPTFAVDQSLIGGARVQIGDRLVDGSLRTQLDHLARELAS